MNKSQLDQRYLVEVLGLDQARAEWGKASERNLSRLVRAGDIGEFNVVVTLPANAAYQRSQDIELVFTEIEGETSSTRSEESRFWGPAKRN